jgi:hypothetical protein
MRIVRELSPSAALRRAVAERRWGLVRNIRKSQSRMN